MARAAAWARRRRARELAGRAAGLSLAWFVVASLGLAWETGTALSGPELESVLFEVLKESPPVVAVIVVMVWAQRGAREQTAAFERVVERIHAAHREQLKARDEQVARMEARLVSTLEGVARGLERLMDRQGTG